MRNSKCNSRHFVLTPLLVAVSMALAPAATAQDRPPSIKQVAALSAFAPVTPVTQHSPRELYEIAMTLRAQGDEQGSFEAMMAAGKAGQPQAQHRLGEIYDSDTAFLRRDYKESIRWYQRARAQGEIIRTQSPRSYGPSTTLR